MVYIEEGSANDLAWQNEIIYVGYEKNELDQYFRDNKSRMLSTPFHGNEGDALLHAYTSNNEEYFIVFKAKEDNFVRPMHFSCTDAGHIIVNVNGCVYRYLIDEKKLINITHYALPPTNGAEHYALFSKEHNIIVLPTAEGLTALTWEKEIWKSEFEWARAGYLELVKIVNQSLFVTYYEPVKSASSLIELNLLSGQILHEKECKCRWYNHYFDESEKARIKF